MLQLRGVEAELGLKTQAPEPSFCTCFSRSRPGYQPSRDPPGRSGVSPALSCVPCTLGLREALAQARPLAQSRRSRLGLHWGTEPPGKADAGACRLQGGRLLCPHGKSLRLTVRELRAGPCRGRAAEGLVALP